MMPYNHCEWKFITYGVQKVKKITKEQWNLAIVSLLPSIVLMIFLLALIK